MNQLIEGIKNEIKQLAHQHNELGDALDDFKEAELLEQGAEQLIVEYCETNGYLVNGFPTEKKQVPEEELEEDYFCRERYQLYLDTLALQYPGVAELMWCYVSSFWENQYQNKEEYLQNVKDNLESGAYYDVNI